jgi:hypothetical protein
MLPQTADLSVAISRIRLLRLAIDSAALQHLNHAIQSHERFFAQDDRTSSIYTKA